MKVYLLAGLIAFLLSMLTCLALIPLLKKLKAGQNIHECVKEHKGKTGTPTMGGIAFIVAATVSSLIFSGEITRDLLVAIVVGVSYMFVGVLDDLLKRKKGENLGLKAWQKFLFQFLVALIAGGYCIKEGKTSLNIPFLGYQFNVGFWMFPLIVFVFLGTVNAVNLTDGLDGLAAGVSAVFFLFFGILLCLQGKKDGLETLSFCLTGALCAYLLFNISRASVFMGDTGSLALGGFAACIGAFSGNALYIAVIGAMFVTSIISVIVQVIYYKATGGKRVFLMAPIHHHFQRKGFSESKIAFAYAAITAAIGLLCIIFVV